MLFDSFQQVHQILASESPFKRLSNGFVVTLEVESRRSAKAAGDEKSLGVRALRCRIEK